MRFEFATATRIIFGAGTLREIGPLARELGRHALVVTGRDPSRGEPLLALIQTAGMEATIVSIPHEPSTEDVTRALPVARNAGCDCVIGFGGGAAIDTAKAISALLPNPGDPLDYLEVVGRGQPLAHPAVPCIAIPTTAGTGAEVTRNAVLSSPAHRVKVSLRGPHLLPRLALIDPELTYSLPPTVSATTGLDALTQLIEPYVSPRANPLTDALCVDGIRRAARALPRVFAGGQDIAARADMSLASLYGGLALANAGLGAVHGFAGPIGGLFPAPHGAVCAILLPHVMAANLHALRSRMPSHPSLARYDEVARLLTGSASATADDGVHWVQALVRALDIPDLRAHGVTKNDFPALVAAAAKASSMKANPIVLTTEELTAILDRACS